MSERIVATHDTLSGQPRIAGTRISVALILEELAAGESPEDIAETYPSISVSDVQAAVAFEMSGVSAGLS